MLDNRQPKLLLSAVLTHCDETNLLPIVHLTERQFRLLHQ